MGSGGIVKVFLKVSSVSLLLKYCLFSLVYSCVGTPPACMESGQIQFAMFRNVLNMNLLNI